jgi:hypothetical protein
VIAAGVRGSTPNTPARWAWTTWHDRHEELPELLKSGMATQATLVSLSTPGSVAAWLAQRSNPGWSVVAPGDRDSPQGRLGKSHVGEVLHDRAVHSWLAQYSIRATHATRPHSADRPGFAVGRTQSRPAAFASVSHCESIASRPLSVAGLAQFFHGGPP